MELAPPLTNQTGRSLPHAYYAEELKRVRAETWDKSIKILQDCQAYPLGVFNWNFDSLIRKLNEAKGEDKP